MPSERCFRLPKAKADTIRNAAIQEFKRVTPEEASINKIIQIAEISRGSFYTYFEDKHDLLRWMLGDFVASYQQFYITELKAREGDLWAVFDAVLDHTIQWVADQGLVEIVGNMMKGNYFSEHFQEASSAGDKMETAVMEHIQTLYELVDEQVCKLELEEFEGLMQLHVAALILALKTYFTNAEEPEKIKASYQRKMRLLCFGAYPRRTEE